MKTNFFFIFILSIFTSQIKAQTALTGFALPDGTVNDHRFKGDMKIDPSGNIWIAFSAGLISGKITVFSIGLAKFNGSTWSTYNTSNSVLPTNYLTSLEFNGNDLWIGTKKGLVMKRDLIWSIYNTSNSGIISDSINDVKVKNGTVWIATDNGISKFNGITWTNYNKSNSTLLSDKVNTIDADNNVNIWCATSVGLSKLYNGVFTNYTSANSGLLNDNINTVFVDTKGNVWIAGDGAKATTSDLDYIGIYKIVNGVIKPLQDIIDYCSQKYLPTSNTTIYNRNIFSSDANGNVFIQGSEAGFNTSQFATILGISSQKINSFGLRQFDLLYQPYGVFILPDNSGNFWFAGNNGFYNSQPNSHEDSLYKFNPTKYVAKPYGAYFGGAEKVEYLDINKVSTPILTRGDMFWDLSKAGYEVPKGSCTKAIFASALWIGGIVNGNLKIAAQTYRQSGNDYNQGPLSIGYASTDSATSASYVKIWKITKWQIDIFKANYSNPNYQIPNDILTWPAHGDTTKGQAWNLAPFINVGGLPNKYEPLLGDYPLIKGDQMLYWIFNDQQLHSETSGSPLGVEVHASAYAFKCDNVNDNDSNTAINYTTFFHYDIFNRTNSIIDSLKVGMWTDVDLGRYDDDYIGCNPKESYGYVYNGNSVDSSWMGYGANPPALAIVQLRGTTNSSGVNLGMKNFMYYNNDWSTQGNPQNPNHYWNYLNSRWKDGSLVTYGGNGKGGVDTTTYMFPGGDNLTGGPSWTEITAGNISGDRRFLMATGPVTLPSGAMQSVDYAIVYSRTSSASIPVLPKLESDVKRVKNWFNTNSFPSCLSLNGINELHTNANQKLIVYPNPASNLLSLQYVSKIKNAHYEVYDLTGRLVLKGNLNESNTISIQSLNAGLYIIKIVDGGEVYSAKFLKE